MVTPLLTVVSQNSSCFGKVLRRFVDVVVRLTHDFCDKRATCGGVIISDWWTSDTATSIAHPCGDVTNRMPWKSLERSRSSRGAWDISAFRPWLQRAKRTTANFLVVPFSNLSAYRTVYRYENFAFPSTSDQCGNFDNEGVAGFSWRNVWEICSCHHSDMPVFGWELSCLFSLTGRLVCPLNLPCCAT